MAISSELIYLGCKKGTVEIWGREKQCKVDTLQTGTNCKVLCLALDANEEVLVVGTSDGKIQVTLCLFIYLFFTSEFVLHVENHINEEILLNCHISFDEIWRNLIHAIVDIQSEYLMNLILSHHKIMIYYSTRIDQDFFLFCRHGD